MPDFFHRFTSDDVDRLRALRVQARTRCRLPVVPYGWSRGTVDPLPVVDVFGSLEPVEEFEWRVFHYRGPGGTGTHLRWCRRGRAEEDPTVWNDRYTLADLPPAADADDFSAVLRFREEPDAWAYLEAAIAMRELEELGGMGGYEKWSKHDIARINPWDTLSDDQRLEMSAYFSQRQYWFVTWPENLYPVVQAEGNRVDLTFFSMRRQYHMPVYIHQDSYDVGSLRGERGRQLIGRVPIREHHWIGDTDDPRL